jgi:hypothetical protein
VNVWNDLSDEAREEIQEGEKALARIERSVDDWLATGHALIRLQAEAMRASHSNQPAGRQYSELWGILARHTPRLAELDKSTRSLAIWLVNEWPTRIRPWWDGLTPKQRREWSHPRSIKRHMTEVRGDDEAQASAVREAITRDYLDSKWRKPGTIASELGEPLELIAKQLEILHRQPSARFKSERKGGKASFEYRFFRNVKPVSHPELVEKLTPLIKTLRSQARTNMATVSIPTFGQVAADLQRLLDEWGAD